MNYNIAIIVYVDWSHNIIIVREREREKKQNEKAKKERRNTREACREKENRRCTTTDNVLFHIFLFLFFLLKIEKREKFSSKLHANAVGGELHIRAEYNFAIILRGHGRKGENGKKVDERKQMRKNRNFYVVTIEAKAEYDQASSQKMRHRGLWFSHSEMYSRCKRPRDSPLLQHHYYLNIFNIF